MNYFCALASLSLLVALPAVGSAGTADFEARYQMSIATLEGLEYETKAVQAFWGDASFMQKCAPSAAPIPAPLTIYFEVKSDGEAGKMVISPETPVAKCIMRHVVNRKFPVPPREFVERIDLEFME